MEGSLLSLYTDAPQDEFFIDKKKRIGVIDFPRYTDFSIDTYYFPLNFPSYLGNTRIATLSAKFIPGDLLCNIFFKCTLPTLPAGFSYIESTGRALIKSITMKVNEVEIETITDDWQIISDQLFLDNNEQIINNLLINGTELYIPLDFFFNSRYSKGRVQNRNYFPLCAVKNQTIYFIFEFSNLIDISSLSGNTLDIKDCSIVFESITLTPVERMKYREPFELRISKVFKEPVTEFNNGLVVTNLTVNLEVSMMVWFLRYKLYENNPDFFIRKYQYGYITNDNINFTNYESFDYMSVYINNQEVADPFSGEKFYKYIQPLNHGLSTPSKSIYMYSFGINPMDMKNGGSFDFSKVNSKTSSLTLKIRQNLILDVTQNYSLNVYHRGYTYLRFEGGTCSHVNIS
jgi:hypothetical protein